MGSYLHVINKRIVPDINNKINGLLLYSMLKLKI